MVGCRITVLKRNLYLDLSESYCKENVGLCPCFKEGQVFNTGMEKPEDFCDWAFNDILRFITVLIAGGNFSKGVFDGWMKEDHVMIACCTDAIRPVIFKLERTND